MKVIDLSHTLHGGAPAYPGDPSPALTADKTPGADGYTTYRLASGLHVGTHIDMPMHMVADARTAADFAPECFMGPGVLLDVQGEDPIAMRACYAETVAPGCAVLLYTGFGAHYGSNAYYTAHPAISEELCGFFVSRGIKLLGMDTPSPDYPPFARHKALLAGGVFILENLANLQALAGAAPGGIGFEVLALPLKIAAEASFVRAVAVCGAG